MVRPVFPDYLSVSYDYDESLIAFEDRAPAVQYMPNKHHHHFGFKLFCLFESDTQATQ